MNKETFLHIAEPCHESWNDMTAAQQGRFCGSCCKTVVDFSQMSDKEILQTLTKAAGKTCGRFTEEQLHRPLYQETPVMSKPRKLFLSAFIPTFLLANTAMAQKSKPVNNKPKQSTEKVAATKLMGDVAVFAPEQVKGESITKKLNERMPICEPTKTSAQKLDTTAIKAPINTGIEQTRVVLGMVSSIKQPPINDTAVSIAGAKMGEVRQGLPEPIVKPIESALTGMLGGVEIYSKVTVADTIKTIVRKTFNQQAFKVFANPASVGNDIKIQFKQAGTYTIQLLDASGRLYFSRFVIMTGSKEITTIKLPQNVVAGNYFIRVIDDKKKEYVDKLIVR